jgi:hypothetical protein
MTRVKGCESAVVNEFLVRNAMPSLHTLLHKGIPSIRTHAHPFPSQPVGGGKKGDMSLLSGMTEKIYRDIGERRKIL